MIIKNGYSLCPIKLFTKFKYLMPDRHNFHNARNFFIPSWELEVKGRIYYQAQQNLVLPKPQNKSN